MVEKNSCYNQVWLGKTLLVGKGGLDVAQVKWISIKLSIFIALL